MSGMEWAKQSQRRWRQDNSFVSPVRGAEQVSCATDNRRPAILAGRAGAM